MDEKLHEIILVEISKADRGFCDFSNYTKHYLSLRYETRIQTFNNTGLFVHELHHETSTLVILILLEDFTDTMCSATPL